jgi:hypothetical protein
MYVPRLRCSERSEYNYVRERVYVGSTEATRGCASVSHVFFFSGLISNFFFDVFQIPSGCKDL